MARSTKPRRPAKKAAAKKTAAKKATAKKPSNSKVQEALSDSLRAQSEHERRYGTDRDKPKSQRPYNVASGPSSISNQKPTVPTTGPKQTVSKGDPNYSKMPNRTAASDKTDASVPTGLLAGLSSPTGQKALEAQAAQVRAQAAARDKYEAANPSLYGTSTAKQAANLAARITAIDKTKQQQKAKGNAVYMGIDPNAPEVNIRRTGPERQDVEGLPGTTEKQKAQELILTKDELLSWLSDDTKVAEIKDAAEKAGFTISGYDDVSKLWNAVVSQAASSYSLSDKRVTPWALIALRGKYLVNGRPADRVTTSTSVDEMDPAQARLMFEQTAQQALGRSPTKAEVDDFIAKAQTIAKDNPSVTKTTHHYDITGNEESQTNQTTGGQDVVNAKAQVAAMDSARQSEDYQSYQAAGNYFPMLFEALSSPV